MSAGGAFQERSRGGMPLPAPALLPRAQPFSAGQCFQHHGFTGSWDGAGFLLPSDSPKSLKPTFWRQRWSREGEGDHASRSKQDFANSSRFFHTELPVSIIFKQIPGCPLTSRASFGSAKSSRQFRRHLTLAGFPATHSWLLPALVLWGTSIFLQAPASGVLLSYDRLCSFRKGKNSFPGQGRGWKTLIPSC